MGHQTLPTINKIQRSDYISIPTPILIGVSGGADSVALLHLIQSYWNEQAQDPTFIHILSCNHNTRENTFKEIQTVRSLCQENIFFETLYEGESYNEDSLRKRRHQQFVHYAQSNNIKTIALGHHLDDRIETTLLNLQRGCHLSGLIGMQDQSPHFLDEKISIIRPLLNTPKSELIQYCSTHSLPFHHDISNDDPTTSHRNHIRSIITTQLITPNRHQSFRNLYNILQRNTENTTQSSSIYQISTDTANQYLCTIPSGSWTADHIASLYHHYNITINPRSTTLETLSNNLNSQSGTKVKYSGLTIKAYQYASIVIVG